MIILLIHTDIIVFLQRVDVLFIGMHYPNFNDVIGFFCEVRLDSITFENPKIVLNKGSSTNCIQKHIIF